MRVMIALLLSTLLLNASETVAMGNLEWQDNQAAKSTKLNWQDAIEYCDELELAGHGDWRLPSIKELQSIVDVNRYDPAIKSTFSHTASDNYWSSSEDVSDPKDAWIVRFKYGYTDAGSKSYERRVRCVRARQ